LPIAVGVHPRMASSLEASPLSTVQTLLWPEMATRSLGFSFAYCRTPSPMICYCGKSKPAKTTALRLL
jgi:hypothetical protein